MNNDEVVIYWSVDAKTSQYRFEEPSKIKLDIENIGNSINSSMFTKCPAYKNFYNTTFALKSPFDFKVRVEKDGFIIDSEYTQNQDFVNEFLAMRDPAAKMFGLQYGYLFWCEDPLVLQQTGAFFNQNNFINKSLVMPGNFDINKWVRPLEVAFSFKTGEKEISVQENDVVCYLNFQTNKKVVLKRFHCTPEISHIVNEMMMIKKFKTKYKPLEWFYNAFQTNKMDKYLGQKIKNNLIE